MAYQLGGERPNLLSVDGDHDAMADASGKTVVRCGPETMRELLTLCRSFCLSFLSLRRGRLPCDDRTPQMNGDMLGERSQLPSLDRPIVALSQGKNARPFVQLSGDE
eukprot:GHVU01008067.1.p3 GENE.GHVU01008067.1~~GHVU01008067.1.p3  ORF type:complete len:107 (-),score=7.35 GHVU01008067.1:2504-2824(-)